MPIDIVKVKELMLDKGLNQIDLAEKSKISKGRLSQILNGKTQTNQIKTIHSIANGLGVKPSEIIKEDV
jgi:transcriptional regulator with XRE-family HTH domain